MSLLEFFFFPSLFSITSSKEVWVVDLWIQSGEKVFGLLDSLGVLMIERLRLWGVFLDEAAR